MSDGKEPTTDDRDQLQRFLQWRAEFRRRAARRRRWVRDVIANPRVSIHLDGVDDVVIVEGEAEVMSGASDDLAERLAAAAHAKFPEYGMTAASYTGPGTIAIRPRKVVAWTDFGQNPTRFRFG